MKVTFKYTICALAIVALAFSCQKNTKDAVQEDSIQTLPMTVTGIFAESSPVSKVFINSSTGETGWEENDAIMFKGRWDGGKYSTTVQLGNENISVDKKSFTVVIPSFTNANDEKFASYHYGCNMFAVYPASAVVVKNGDDVYAKHTYSSSNLPLMCGFNDIANPTQFTFYNLCSIISFTVDGDDYDGYIFSGKNNEIVGYTNYQSNVFKKDDGTLNTEWIYAGAGVTSISGTVIADGTTENYICIPSGVDFTGGFTVILKKDGIPVKQFSTSKHVDLRRDSETYKCKFLALGKVSEHLSAYVAPSEHTSSISTDGATALDASGNANCYIVDGSVAANAEKVFTFKAYKGNGTAGVGTVAKAELLWETWNNAETVTENSVIAAVDFEKKAENDYYTMVFKMPATLHAGNALIAAKDAGDNILWSWHIWVPETSVTADATGVGGMAQAGILDRNLGALVVTSPSAADASIQSAGLMYQWGRKDPFMGPSAFGTNSAATVNGTAKTNVTEQKTEAWTIQNPTVFIAYNGDWSTVVNNDIWADSDDKAKSISDPCPPGYRVPQRKTSLRLWSGTSLVGEASWGLDATHYWFKVGTPNPVVFPIAGYIYKSGGYDQSGTEAYIWTAHKGSDTIAYALRLKSDGTTKNEQPVKASGANVRCVGIAE